MYCPKCSTKAVPGQRYCRTCGANLGAIWDAMEGKRGQIDFETLKSDLRELGMNLRVGFEQAKENFKAQTNKLSQPNQTVQQNWRSAGQTPPPISPAAPVITPAPQTATLPPQVEREMRKTLKDLRRMYNKVKLANTRKHSLQQGTLALFSGGAALAAWKMLLHTAGASGFLNNVSRIVQEQTGVGLWGVEPVIQMLWILALIPLARGVAHLINGIFFAPSPDELAAESDILEAPAPMFYYQPQPQAMPSAVETPSVISTNELERDTNSIPAAKQPASIVEDETRRFEAQEAKPA